MEGLIKEKRRILVIGGVNMDIGGRITNRMVMRDSNPGVITARPGGVGRNIAHNLRLLGMDVSLIAGIGGDMYAHGIIESCRALGLDLSMARILPEERSSAYLYIADEEGDMQLAISDMDITRRIDAEYLHQHIRQINGFDAVVLDANLQPETLQYLAEHCSRPLYADAVSSVKALRLQGILSHLTAIKPNAIEAQALTGECDMEQAAEKLLAYGVKRVFISLGAKGLLAAENGKMFHLPCESVPVDNTTGAGDSATAAIVWADCLGLSLELTAAAAVKAGALTCMSADANCETLSELPALLQKYIL